MFPKRSLFGSDFVIPVDQTRLSMEKFLFRKVEIWLVILIGLVCLPASVFWGARIVTTQTFPYTIVQDLIAFVKGDSEEDTSLAAKIKSEFGGTDRFVVESEDQVNEKPTDIPFSTKFKAETYEFNTSLSEGYYLIYGIFNLEGKAQPTAVLLDTQGQIIKEWIFPFTNNSRAIKRFQYTPNGILVSASSLVLRAKSWCGNDLWQSPGVGFHHDIDYGNGEFTLWQNDWIVSVDERTGQTAKVIQMRDIVMANPEMPLLRATLKFFRYDRDTSKLIFDNKQHRPKGTEGKHILNLGDNFHQNKVAVNRGHTDYFADGSLLISIRQLDLVIIIDPESGKILWHETFNRQHDPDWMPQGIVVYNNRGHFDQTRIEYVGFDGTREMLIDENVLKFKRRITGNSQLYSDGSIVFQGGDGRVYHVNADKQLVTEFKSRLVIRNGFYLTEEEVAGFERLCK